MSHLSKRSTVYFEKDLHQALKIKAATTNQSISQMVNQAIRYALKEDQEDISAFSQRASESIMSYEALLDDLKTHGKI
ncbi:CopG family transcriptional regulator [Candidatus Thioglobus sp.]|uniref:CopG family transcriptional regulator n=1 Tax=Candidatus Thioglobus sp. TaxID=2026721 RepID=UPI003D0E0DE7